EKNIDDILERYITSASREEVDVHCDRVLQRLRVNAQHGATHASDSKRVAFSAGRWLALASAIAGVLLAVFVGKTILWRDVAPAVVENADGGLYRIIEGAAQSLRATESLAVGELIRSNGGSGSMLVLADGSRVEMRSQSELSLERVTDGLR